MDPATTTLLQFLRVLEDLTALAEVSDPRTLVASALSDAHAQLDRTLAVAAKFMLVANEQWEAKKAAQVRRTGTPS